MSAVPSPSQWNVLRDCLRTLVPFDLLTLLEVDWEKRVVRRTYSSDDEHYPSGGVKDLMDSTWGKQVLQAGRVLRASGPEEMKALFGDHEVLLSLGLQQALNVPVIQNRRVAWTLNLLRRSPAFDDMEIELVKGLL